LLQFTDWVGNGRLGDPFASATVPGNLDTQHPGGTPRSGGPSGPSWEAREENRIPLRVATP
jgi:hypothetical protein